MKQRNLNRSVSAFLICIGIFFGTTFAAQAQEQWIDKITLYVPNRVLDLLDSFTLNLGVGLTAHANLRATHELNIGGGISCTAQMIKDFNRQYGFARRNGVYSGMGPFMSVNMERRPAFLLAKEYWWDRDGLVSPADEIFAAKTGAVDFWEFGGSLGVGVIEADVSIHPIEILDALLGFFFLDINHDDLSFEDFH